MIFNFFHYVWRVLGGIFVCFPLYVISLLFKVLDQFFFYLELNRISDVLFNISVMIEDYVDEVYMNLNNYRYLTLFNR